MVGPLGCNPSIRSGLGCKLIPTIFVLPKSDKEDSRVCACVSARVYGIPLITNTMYIYALPH